MNALVAAALVLLAGGALCLLPLRNTWRAGFGLASQAVATLLVWSAVWPVLAGAPLPMAEWPWAYPIGAVRFRLDALGAFFLSWSLPMTLLGAIYAVGYLRKYFDSPRHVGVHFGLLNMISMSFLMVYTGEHAVTFLMGWEIAALSAWLLVIWDYSNQKVRFAGFNYLVSTHVGLIFLVAAFMILYTQTQSWYLADFGLWLSGHPGKLRDAVFLLLVTSFGLKSAFLCSGTGACVGADVRRDPQGRAVCAAALFADLWQARCLDGLVFDHVWQYFGGDWRTLHRGPAGSEAAAGLFQHRKRRHCRHRHWRRLSGAELEPAHAGGAGFWWWPVAYPEPCVF